MTTSIEVQTTPPKWQPATWKDYLACDGNPALEKARLFFDQNCLLIDMTPEGIEHAGTNDLFTICSFSGLVADRGRPLTLWAAAQSRSLTKKPVSQT